MTVTTMEQRAAAVLDGLDESGESILRAAREVFGDQGLRRTTVEDVAIHASLARATVYRKFANKDELVEAVLLAEMREYLRSLDAMAETIDGFAEQNVEGFVLTLRYIRENSLLASVVARDGAWGLAYFSAAAGPVIAAARDYLAAKMRAAQANGESDEFDPLPVAELIVRMCHSLMLTPGGVIPPGDDEAARSFARSVIVPLMTRR